MHLRRIQQIGVCLLLSAGAVFLFSCQSGKWHGDRKLVILGIDGMDPQLLKKFMAEGKMPNFSSLSRKGSFRLLTTSIPPQSPVAWSNLITGMNAGGHGIFDFIHRDPRTLRPYFSASRVEPPKHGIHLGNWVIPLGGGSAEQLRQGKSFWETLDDYGVPNLIFRMPSNFPPVKAKGHTLSGMGTPDLRGSYGTFSFYTDDPMSSAGWVEGGQIIPVEVKDSQVTANLVGPDNSFRKRSPPALEPFTVSVDPLDAVAKFSVQDEKFVLREGEWSDWVHLQFPLIPFVGNVKGICRFYLKQAHPRFELYVSPVNIDPADPALPISTPKEYSRELAEEVANSTLKVFLKTPKPAPPECSMTRNICNSPALFSPNIAEFSMWSFPNSTQVCSSSTFPVLIGIRTCCGASSIRNIRNTTPRSQPNTVLRCPSSISKSIRSWEKFCSMPMSTPP